MFSGGDGPSVLTNLKGQVRDNPLAVSLISAGLVWLMVGQSASATATTAWDEAKLKVPKSQSNSSLDSSDGTNMWSTATDAAASAAETGSEALRSAKHFASDMVGGAAQTATNAANRARHKLGGVQQEPLVLAAVGFAVGAAIGGLLPHSELEDQMVGGSSDKVRGTAEDLLGRGLEAGRQVATDALDAAKEEADRQGLAGSGDNTIVEKVVEVAKTAVSTAEETIREKTS